MSLLSTMRALDDSQFKWRVMAASFLHASSFMTISEANGKFYAITTLLNPQTVDMSMVALVAMDPAVSAAITVTTDGTVSTAAVTDADIQRVVSARWALVGHKYKSDPLSLPVVPTI